MGELDSMNVEQRMNHLKRLMSQPADAGTKNIAYKQTHVKPMPAHRIDLNYLSYNPYNGRIGTLVSAYEEENGAIAADTEQGKSIIEKFLWESQEDRNKKTMANLQEEGQREPGIVTLDGVIIDGNRRASLLARVARKTNQSPAYFNAVILPDKLEDNVREIKRLETQYQMGLDEKLGYNALEKYLQIQELYDHDFDFDEIAKFMNMDKPEIQRLWEVKRLMDEYLKQLGYENMYTRLDRAEDWFWQLQQSMRRFDLSKGSGASDQVRWSYSENDVEDLKLVMFDYIRASREPDDKFLDTGQSYREICSARKNGFFRHGHIWKKFVDKHFEDFQAATDSEKSIDEYREENPGLSLSKILQIRDQEFTKKVLNPVKENFGKTKSSIDTENEKEHPRILLTNALAKLEAVDVSSGAFEDLCRKDKDIRDIVVSIGKKHFAIKKAVERVSLSESY